MLGFSCNLVPFYRLNGKFNIRFVFHLVKQWFVLFLSLVLKEEASDYLELDTVKNLVKKYSQFINFPIYVWSSKVSISVAESF